jgi:hypothetical protein
MNSEARLILEVWDSVRDFIPTPKRQDIAEQVLRRFEEYGVEPESFHDLVGEDKYLEEAFNTLYGDDPEIDPVDEDGYDELE